MLLSMAAAPYLHTETERGDLTVETRMHELAPSSKPSYSNLFSMHISSILMWWACSKEVARHKIPKIKLDLKWKVNP
jgi:hypothetical protein